MDSDLEINTDRLDLAALCEEHAELLFPTLADASLYDYTGGRPPQSVSALRKLYALQATRRSPDDSEIWLNWVITVRTSDEVIGYVQATIRDEHADVAWVIGPAWQGHGYATEATLGMLAWLYRAGIQDIAANIQPSHKASNHVAIKTGFSRTNQVHDGEDIWVHSKPRP
jgi:RimJ/RimL family protein N-acetyltransferase